jgi:hypothetical protein
MLSPFNVRSKKSSRKTSQIKPFTLESFLLTGQSALYEISAKIGLDIFEAHASFTLSRSYKNQNPHTEDKKARSHTETLLPF